MTDLSLEQQPEQRTATRRSFPGLQLVRRYMSAFLVFLATLAFLQWGVPALDIPPFILPTPTAVLAAGFDPESTLAYHFGITALEAIGGLLIGSVLAFLMAVLFVHVPPLEDALYPWAIVLQTIPLVAIAPMLIIWFGNGMLARMVMSAIFAFFPMLVNSVRGLRQADRATLELLQSYAVSPWQLFWTLRMPNSLPFVFTGLKIASTLAVIGAIVGEFAGANKGLGFAITISTYYLRTDRTFAAIGCAA
ncbi:MAG: ABC transporter permease [Chloroflexaceae bacterium]|nr:ABC transporter permease [Chloroflexaceae bacterium]